MSAVASRLAVLRARIAAAAARGGRPPDAVRIVAVAKTATPADLRAAWDAGLRDFGHNRVQALRAHHAVLPAARWHLIGPLQRNKAADALALVSMIQTVADTRLAERLQRLLEARGGAAMPVLVQVNPRPADGRAGCSPAELPALLAAFSAWPALAPRGLMTLAGAGAAPGELRRHFAGVRELAERATADGLLPPAPELSMGMSDDFEIAVAEGATLVRLGRALFPPADEPTEA